MDYICIIKAGLIAGVVMGIFAMSLNMMKITSLDLTKYMGCMLTGQASGMISMIVGLGIHLIMSIVFAFIYVWIANHFNITLTIINGAIFGLLHGLAGFIMPMMDNMNNCVTQGKVKAMKMYAQGYGNMGTITFFVAHAIYGMVLAISL